MHICRRRAVIPTVGTRAEFLIIFAYIAAYKLDQDSSLPWVRCHPSGQQAWQQWLLLCSCMGCMQKMNVQMLLHCLQPQLHKVRHVQFVSPVCDALAALRACWPWAGMMIRCCTRLRDPCSQLLHSLNKCALPAGRRVHPCFLVGLRLCVHGAWHGWRALHRPP